MLKRQFQQESPEFKIFGAVESITIDCTIFGFHAGSLEVLLVRHSQGISKGKWGLPRGWILKNEDIDVTAHRLLQELTGLKSIYLEQLKAFGHPNRFPLGRVKFTLLQLMQLYEEILKVELDKPNFRRKFLKMKLLQDLGEKQEDVSHRAAKLYKFDQEVYIKLTEKGFNFEF